MENVPRWVFPAGLVAVVVVVAVLVAHLGPGAGSDDQGGPEGGEVANVPPATGTQGEPEPSDPPEGAVPPDAATKRTLLALRAYATFSYKDKSHKAWVENLRPHVAPSVVHEFVEVFSPDDDVYEQMWRDDVVADKVEGRPRVDGVDVAKAKGGGWRFTYAFHVRTRVDGGSWVDGGDRRVVVMTVVKRDGGWVVSELSESVS